MTATHAVRRNARFGWRPDLPDHRDHKLLLPKFRLPSHADLSHFMPPIYDQGALGSCTANAIAAAIQFERHKQGLPDFLPSRLFIYYNERAMEGTVNEDAGAEIRDGIKSVHKQGVPDETLWPYKVKRFAVKPSKAAYTAARADLVSEYLRVNQTLDDLRRCLVAGFPFVFGFTCYPALESAAVAKSGILPMPKPNESAIGGHAVLGVGYDDHRHAFLIRNSWGADWGREGHFWMPFDYVSNNNLADDFWAIRAIGA